MKAENIKLRPQDSEDSDIVIKENKKDSKKKEKRKKKETNKDNAKIEREE